MIAIKFFSFNELPLSLANEMFFLRFKTFKARLNWKVVGDGNMEFDEYDNENASYLLGFDCENLVCGVRLIDLKFPNMIINTFRDFFDSINLPQGHFLESSRIFVDKKRARKLRLKGFVVSVRLYSEMIRFARNKKYDGILTMVNYPMLRILSSSGWMGDIVEEGVSEKNERVFIINLPVDLISEKRVLDKIPPGQ